MKKDKLLYKLLVVSIVWLALDINSVIAATVTVDLAVNLSDQEKQIIKDNLSLYQFRDSPFLDEGYVNNLKAKGVNELKFMLQTFGYYKPVVKVSSTHEDSKFSVHYSIDLGPPVKINAVDIHIEGEGKSDSEIIHWQQSYPLKPGDILLHSKYEEAKKNLLQLLHNRGYFASVLQENKVEVKLEELAATIFLKISTGPRYFFGETFYIQESYDLGYLNRFLPYRRGDLFHSDLLAELHKRLLKSQEFSSVEINPEISRADDNFHVPITVRLTPRKRWRFSVGLGYGTDVGIEASGAVNQRRFTRRGHQTGANATLSDTKQEAAVNYTIPATNPWADYYNIRYGFTHELTDDTERYTNALTAKAVYEINVLRNIVSLSFEDEQFLVGEGSKTRTKLLVPSFAMHYNPLEDSVLERLKFDLYGEIRGSGEQLVSGVSFTQFITRGNLKYKLSKRWSVLSRYNIGVTDIADFENLPVSYRFFAGGDYSVRGYEYNSLSPVDENGDRVGGRNLLVGSVELQYRFLEHWDVATFYDIGNAFNIGNTDLKAGAGAGIGWIYSLLSVRVYAANALDIPDRPWKFHLIIGADL